MLELYQAYADYHDMMDLTEQLVAHVAREVSGGEQVTYEDRALDLVPAVAQGDAARPGV